MSSENMNHQVSNRYEDRHDIELRRRKTRFIPSNTPDGDTVETLAIELNNLKEYEVWKEVYYTNIMLENSDLAQKINNEIRKKQRPWPCPIVFADYGNIRSLTREEKQFYRQEKNITFRYCVVDSCICYVPQKVHNIDTVVERLKKRQQQQQEEQKRSNPEQSWLEWLMSSFTQSLSLASRNTTASATEIHQPLDLILPDIEYKRVTVPKRFLSDGVTSLNIPIPTREWWDLPTRAWLVHDWLYYCHQYDDGTPCSREEADQIMSWILWQDDFTLASVTWLKVCQLFAQSSWENSGANYKHGVSILDNRFPLKPKSQNDGDDEDEEENNIHITDDHSDMDILYDDDDDDDSFYTNNKSQRRGIMMENMHIIDDDSYSGDE